MVKVHIAMVGETTENIVNGVMKVGADELYPIVSKAFKNSSITRIRDKLDGVIIHRRFNNRELVVDPFSDDAYFQIVGLIVDIANARKDAEILVNITGGTNLMSSAAAMGAMLTESKAYYITMAMKGEAARIIEIPFMGKSFKVLENSKRRRIVEVLSKRGSLSNDELARELEINKKSISKHMKLLDDHGIVKRERQGRHVLNGLTDNIMVKLMKNYSEK